MYKRAVATMVGFSLWIGAVLATDFGDAPATPTARWDSQKKAAAAQRPK